MENVPEENVPEGFRAHPHDMNDAALLAWAKALVASPYAVVCQPDWPKPYVWIATRYPANGGLQHHHLYLLSCAIAKVLGEVPPDELEAVLPPMMQLIMSALGSDVQTTVLKLPRLEQEPETN